jgi:CheY-like chemotaxis protein
MIGVAHTAADAARSVADLKPDLVLLDNYLPDRPGIDLAAELRVEILMVTADASATSVRAAFAAGAVNYLIKPFGSEQLTSRLRAYVRYRTLLGDHAQRAARIGCSARAIRAATPTACLRTGGRRAAGSCSARHRSRPRPADRASQRIARPLRAGAAAWRKITSTVLAPHGSVRACSRGIASRRGHRRGAGR